PMVRTFASRLPGCTDDTLQALWLMRHYRNCLCEGGPWLRCPDVQFPVGAPLGNFSPLHLQAALYLPLSLALENDVLCYNLVWLAQLVFTGLGTFALAWHVLRDRFTAGAGGLLAMLGGPVLMQAHGHLELTALGSVPIFLVSWMRWVDQPTKGRLLT